MKSNRRRFITTSAAGAVSSALVRPARAEAQPSNSMKNLLATENAKEGAIDWQLTRVCLDEPKGFRTSLIEGYCSKQSVKAGETLEIFVSTKPSARFEIEIFRMGYYGGCGARLMTKLGPFEGKTQADPPIAEKRLRECTWEASTSLTIPPDWVSGVYLGRLTTVPDAEDKPYWQSYVIFIVKDDRKADVLFQCSDNTWQAYNRWPDSYSLYTDPRGAHARDVAVSFDRPYGKYAQIFENPQSVGSGEFLCFEFPLAYWLEEQGYDVTYCSNSDVLAASEVMRCKAFLSVAHDEYWDLRQYDALKDGIAAGVSVLWLCGNAVFGVTPFTASSDGRPKRILTRVGHFAGMTDPEIEAERKVFTQDFKRVGPDESLIIGARSIVPFNGGGDWVCTQPHHWIYEGTGMKKGESIPGLVGWEHHGAPAALPGLEVLAEGTAWRGGVTPAHWTATIFPGPKRNFVFNAATIFWPQALGKPPGHMLPWSHWSRPQGPDERVQRITANLLKRALA
jgi:hypothetical protein